MAAVEQANCSLLEEVVRLHGKLRVGQRGGVEERREELGSVGGQVQEELWELHVVIVNACMCTIVYIQTYTGVQFKQAAGTP